MKCVCLIFPVAPGTFLGQKPKNKTVQEAEIKNVNKIGDCQYKSTAKPTDIGNLQSR